MKNSYYQTKLAVVFFTALVAISAGSWAMRQALKVKNEPKKISQPTVGQSPKPDEHLVRQLNEALQVLDPARAQCTLAGTIKVTGLADSSQNIRQDFVVARKLYNFYMKQGDTELIGEDGTYLTIDPGHKKVFIAHPEIVRQPLIIDINALMTAIASESYAISSRSSNSLQSISLLNERHFSCKEYTVTYDTLSKKIVRIYSRLANPEEPQSSKHQKIIDIRLSRCDTVAVLQKYLTRAAVIGNDHRLTRAYADYELIAY